MDKLICLKIYTKIIGLRNYMPSFYLERNFRLMKVNSENADQLYFTSASYTQKISKNLKLSLINSASVTKNE